MFSRLQAAIPLLTDDIHVDRWVKKIFPWKADPRNPDPTPPDSRECYRLDMENFHPLEATLVSERGAIIDINVLNLSASGLSCRVSTVEPLFPGQVLTLVFVLPLDEPTLVKTEARLIAINPNESWGPIVLHMEFSRNLDNRKRDLIHGYIVKKQFDLIKQLKRGGCLEAGY